MYQIHFSLLADNGGHGWWAQTDTSRIKDEGQAAAGSLYVEPVWNLGPQHVYPCDVHTVRGSRLW